MTARRPATALSSVRLWDGGKFAQRMSWASHNACRITRSHCMEARTHGQITAVPCELLYQMPPVFGMARLSLLPKKFTNGESRASDPPAALIGHVQAPDAERAIKEAITKYEISSPHEQARLAAKRVKEVRP